MRFSISTSAASAPASVETSIPARAPRPPPVPSLALASNATVEPVVLAIVTVPLALVAAMPVMPASVIRLARPWPISSTVSPVCTVYAKLRPSMLTSNTLPAVAPAAATSEKLLPVATSAAAASPVPLTPVEPARAPATATPAVVSRL